MTHNTKGVFEIYKSQNSDWYWRMKSPDGHVIAIGGEGFLTKQEAVSSVRTVAKYVTKQVHSRRGQDPIILEIDDDPSAHTVKSPVLNLATKEAKIAVEKAFEDIPRSNNDLSPSGVLEIPAEIDTSIIGDDK